MFRTKTGAMLKLWLLSVLRWGTRDGPLARAGHNTTLVAIANKTARIAWAVLRSGENDKIA